MDFDDIVNSSGGNISAGDAKVLYETAMDIGAKNILEIGSREGGSSMIFGHVAKANGGHVYCIEPMPQQKWFQNIQRHGLSDYVTLIEGMSPWVQLPEGLVFDEAFFDGDHRSRWLIADYHYHEPSVRPGGLLAFHDWTGAKGTAEKIRRAVSMILEDDELEEVARHEADKCGVIVFRKPEGIESFSRRCKLG